MAFYTARFTLFKRFKAIGKEAVNSDHPIVVSEMKSDHFSLSDGQFRTTPDDSGGFRTIPTEQIQFTGVGFGINLAKTEAERWVRSG